MNEEWHTNLSKLIARNLTLDNKPDVLSRIGGFSILYGQLKVNHKKGNIEPLNILSNRGDFGKVFSQKGDSSINDEIGSQKTFGLSNSLYNDPWKKVNLGEKLLKDTIKKAVDNDFNQDQLIESCFEILSHDTYDKNIAINGSSKEAVLELRNSIYIPPIELKTVNQFPGSSTVGKYYGTRTQTIILLDKGGNVHYYERDIHNSDTFEKDLEIKTNYFLFNVSNK